MNEDNKDSTKVAFNEWLTQSKDHKVKTTSLTALSTLYIIYTENRYIGHID